MAEVKYLETPQYIGDVDGFGPVRCCLVAKSEGEYFDVSWPKEGATKEGVALSLRKLAEAIEHG